MNITLRTFLTGVALTGCLVGFILQCLESMDKFFTGKTTITQTMKSPKDRILQLPTITICPDPPFKVHLFLHDLFFILLKIYTG
jgi:hypothetical protein